MNVLALAGPDVPTPRRFRMLPAIDRPESRGARLAAGVVAVLFAAAYLWFVLQYWAPAHPGVDQSGYLVGGKQLAWTGSTGLKPAHPLGFVSNMYVRNDATGYNYPKYPVGLPLLYAIMLWTCGGLGPKAAFLVSPISAAMAVLGLYFLARRFAGTFASLAGMIILATSPVVLILANNPNSHASCLAFCVWGAALLIRFWETASIWRGLLGGFLLGFAVTIRYPEGVFGLMIGVTTLGIFPWRLLGQQIRRMPWHTVLAVTLLVATTIGFCVTATYGPFGDKPGVVELLSLGVVGILAAATSSPTAIVIAATAAYLYLTSRGYFVGKTGYTEVLLPLVIGLGMLGCLWQLRRVGPRYFAPLIGWLIPVVALVLFNRIAMGTWTGYDTTNESAVGRAFTLENMGDNWELFTRKLHDTGLFFTLPLGILGMALALRTGVRRGLLLWCWLLPISAVYLAYYWAPENGLSYLRFLCTLLPPLAVGAAVALDVPLATAATPLARAVTPLAVGMVVLAASSMGLYRGLLRLDTDDRVPISMESQFRQEINLSALADVVTKTVPKHSVLIGPSPQMHAIQFLGDYECFDAETFRGAYATRLAAEAERNERDPDNPNPIQPARRNFILKQIKGKNDDQLAEVQLDIARAAIADHRRVFLLVPRSEAPALRGRYDKVVTGLKSEVRAVFNELPRPRPPEDAPPGVDLNARNPAGPGGRPGPNGPNRPNGPPNGPGAGRRGMFRGGARNDGANLLEGAAPQTWQVIEIVKKETPPAAPQPVKKPAPPAATRPAPLAKTGSSPTTRPAVKPAATQGSRPPSTAPTPR